MTITYGELIRQRRLDLGMTQKELADAACVSRQYVNGVENGYKGPRWDTLMMVTDVLGLEIRVEAKDD